MVKFELVPLPCFLDYIRSGTKISAVLAIDYTASNGNYSSPSSLHNLGPNPNQYLQAIQGVVSLIEPYDEDRSFPVYGFGGTPRQMGLDQVSHCFAMNGNASNPEINGVEAICETYA